MKLRTASFIAACCLMAAPAVAQNNRDFACEADADVKNLKEADYRHGLLPFRAGTTPQIILHNAPAQVLILMCVFSDEAATLSVNPSGGSRTKNFESGECLHHSITAQNAQVTIRVAGNTGTTWGCYRFF